LLDNSCSITARGTGKLDMVNPTYGTTIIFEGWLGWYRSGGIRIVGSTGA
jgi:hypothetical protein